MLCPTLYSRDLQCGAHHSCWPGLTAGELEMLSLENSLRQKKARLFPDVHSKRSRGKLQCEKSAWVSEINLFAPRWSALAPAAQGGCAPFLEIFKTPKDSPYTTLEILKTPNDSPYTTCSSFAAGLALAEGWTGDLQKPTAAGKPLLSGDSHSFFFCCSLSWW